MPPGARPTMAIVCLILSLPIAIGDAWAQFGRPMSRSASFIAPPRAVEQYLREAERAIADGEMSEAVIRLGDLLERDVSPEEDDDQTAHDYFLEDEEAAAGRTTLRRSVLRRAREMLGELPASGIETYELRYGPSARRGLSRAVERRDVNGLREVRRRYFHTVAGYQASYLLAQESLFRGHPLAASLLLDEVVATPRAVETLGDSVVLIHAAACRLGGREVPELGPRDGAVSVDGQRQAWPKDDEVSRWIEKNFAAREQFARTSAVDHPVAGGTADRNGNDAGELPLSMEFWKQRATASPNQERKVLEKIDELVARGTLAPPSWTPLRVGDSVLMRSTERLLGVDLKTGKLVWEYPWTSPSPAHEETEISFDLVDDEDDSADLLVQRIWNDLPYGRITSDGERVYMLHDLGLVEGATFGPWGQRGSRPGDGSRNTLVALELSTEGKLAWVAGSRGEAGSSFSEAFFLGPPLPLDGRLYVMVELAGDICLSCLDPESGRELWRQPLVAVETGGIEVDPIRRIAGAVPTYHEGVLLCPTAAGALVAIDLADRAFRWGVTFNRSSEFERRAFGRQGVDAMQLMQRWSDGAAVAAETDVLVTPVESDRAYGFDLLTGEPLFNGINRIHLRYLAGIRDGRFFLVGADRMQAYDVQTGRPVWSTDEGMVSAGQRISGRGMFGEDSYYLPTTTNQIVRVSLEDGSVLGRRSTDFTLGNLFAVEGRVFSQSATELSVALGERTLEPWVASRLAEDPDDLEATVRKAQLMIQRGDRAGALSLLESAREQAPDNDEVRMLSVLAMLGILREDPTADDDLYERLEELVDQPETRAELVSLRIRAAIERADYREAISQLIGLSSLVGGPTAFRDPFDAVGDEEHRQCSIDSWIAARATEIATQAPEDELASMNEILANELEPWSDGSNEILRRFVAHFGELEGTQPIRDELFKRFRTTGTPLEMERLSLGPLSPERLGRLSDDRLVMLGEAYATGRFGADAARVAAELQARGNEDAAGRLRADPEVRPRESDADGWPDEVRMEWDSVRTVRRASSIASGIRYLPMTRLAGQRLRGWTVVRENANPLAIRDPNGFVSPITIEDDLRQGGDLPKSIVSGGVMIVVLGNQIVALDLFRTLDNDPGGVLWTRSTAGDSGSIAKRRSVMNVFDDQVLIDVINTNVPSPVTAEFRVGPVTGNRLLILQGGELMCLDLMTSKLLWRNSDAPVGGAVVCDERHVAVVSPDTGEVVTFNLLDGEKRSTKPWEYGDVWASSDRYVLAYEATDEQPDSTRRFDVRLIDPIDDEVRLELRTAAANRRSEEVPAAYGQVLDGRYLTLFDTDGVATIWDLVRATEVARVEELPKYPDLNGLQATLLDGQFLLMPRRRQLPRGTGGTATLQTSNKPNHETVDAVFAISTESGEVRWTREFDSPWGCTLAQPAATPVLTLTRAWSDFSNTGSRKREVEVNAIDVVDGETLAEGRREFPSSANLIETVVTAQPGQQRVRCVIGSEELTLVFGESEEGSEDGSNEESQESESR